MNVARLSVLLSALPHLSADPSLSLDAMDQTLFKMPFYQGHCGACTGFPQ